MITRICNTRCSDLAVSLFPRGTVRVFRTTRDIFAKKSHGFSNWVPKLWKSANLGTPWGRVVKLHDITRFWVKGFFSQRSLILWILKDSLLSNNKEDKRRSPRWNSAFTFLSMLYSLCRYSWTFCIFLSRSNAFFYSRIWRTKIVDISDHFLLHKEKQPEWDSLGIPFLAS